MPSWYTTEDGAKRQTKMREIYAENKPSPSATKVSTLQSILSIPKTNSYAHAHFSRNATSVWQTAL